jgi:hypothetical protein
MANATVTLYFATKVAEFEIEIDAEGDVSTGGNYSDEPAWTEVENVTLTLSNGKRLPRRMLASLTARDWDIITEALIEG